jgi:hypothetical protein
MFLWDSLTSVEQKDKVYYIGDSKYYKQHNEIGRESIAKQYTYARNVIQWNLNLFFGEDADDKPLETDFCLRDEKTEGYNIIPNFFISATIPDDLSYSDTIDETKRRAKTHVSRQFPNRLFDRDTLLITHYDVNFLYIVQLYGRNNANQKKEWRKKVRNIFRDKIQDELASRYNFFAMRAKPGVNDREYIETHFRDILGKVFAPYDNDKGILALALDNRPEFEEENEALRAEISEAFDIVECSIKQDARKILPPTIPSSVIVTTAEKRGVLLLTVLNDTTLEKIFASTQLAIGIKEYEDYFTILENLGNIGFLDIHKKKKDSQHIFELTSVKLCSKNSIPEYASVYAKDNTMFLLVGLGNEMKSMEDLLDCMKANPKYDAKYSTIEDLM